MFDRRSFISHSAAIAAAMAALRDSPLRAEEPKKEDKTPSLADTVRVAVIGTFGRCRRQSYRVACGCRDKC